MKQEDKDLLIKDLCARLPYGVKGLYYSTVMSLHMVDPFDNYHPLYCVTKSGSEYIGIDEFKPYLFPMTSMTEEQRNEYHELIHELNIKAIEGEISNADCSVVEVDWLSKNYLDYRGLIPKDLAKDATGLNIY